MKRAKAKGTKESIGIDEFKRHTGALMERVDDAFKLTNEEIRGMHSRLDSHEQKLDSHTQMIGQLMQDMSVVKDDLVTIKQELKRKVDYDDFIKLEKRVLHLEIAKNK